MIPMEIMLAITDVPPPERSGSVIPVTGIRPIVIAIFSNTWNKNIPVKPITISAPYKSTESRMIFVKRIIRNAYRQTTTAPPMKPSSSTTTE